VDASHPAGRELEREVLRRHPIQRMGTPSEVADLAVMLCSDEAGFMTGSNVVIDGGYSRL
jgi:NAD(P)-dependent dehydrogenase (short-subunit alcohol dehydrogenase family)